MPIRRRPRGDGFTLVEVVVSLAILSLVMLATITGLRTLANTQGTLERITERVDTVRSVSSFLRDTLESAVGGGGADELTLGGGRAEEVGYFELTDQSLSWNSTVLIGENVGGSYLLRVAREDDLLVLRWQQPDASGRPGDWAAAEARTLAVELEEFDVSWRQHYEDEWRRDWGRDDIAHWVRLQIKTSGRYWPELIVQVSQ